MKRVIVAVVIAIVIAIGAAGAIYFSTTATLSNNQIPTTRSSTTNTPSDSDFLIFTQKGMAELSSPSGTLLGYSRLFNISDSVPTAVFNWLAYPTAGVKTPILLLPLNNGTVKVVNITSMKIVKTLSVGSKIGFIGVQYSPDQTLAGIADGPSGIVEVVNLKTLQVVFRDNYTIPGTTSTAYPCDVRWTPDGNSLVVPMKNNDTVVTLNAASGAITAERIFPKGTNPYMLSVNPAGTMVGTELIGNNTDVFLSLPALTPLGHVAVNNGNFRPLRGVFTQDGESYLEASLSSNVIDVVSLNNFKLVNTITLTASPAPGLADMELLPGSSSVYVVQHGNPTTGGIVYVIPLANIASSSAGPTVSIALTTAPAIALPVSITLGNYLANNVLSPPVTGLHC